MSFDLYGTGRFPVIGRRVPTAPPDSIQPTPVQLLAIADTEDRLKSIARTVLWRMPYSTGVEEELVIRIVQHNLCSAELYLLKGSWKFDFRERPVPRMYDDLRKLTEPLIVYFQVLIAYADMFPVNSRQNGLGGPSLAAEVGMASMQYVANLMQFNELYQWHAVINYHMEFFDRRRGELKAGQRGVIESWGNIDGELEKRYCLPNPKVKPAARGMMRRYEPERWGKAGRVGM